MYGRTFKPKDSFSVCTPTFEVKYKKIRMSCQQKSFFKKGFYIGGLTVHAPFTQKNPSCKVHITTCIPVLSPAHGFRNKPCASAHIRIANYK